MWRVGCGSGFGGFGGGEEQIIFVPLSTPKFKQRDGSHGISVHPSIHIRNRFPGSPRFHSRRRW